MLRRTLLALLLTALSSSSAFAAAEQVSIWTEVEFDEQGQARSLRFVDAQRYSQGLMDGLRERVLRLRIAPPRLHEQPASLRSGLRLRVVLDEDDERAQVQLLGVDFQPLLLERAMAPLPAHLHPDFDKTYRVRCEVDVQGSCRVAGIETDGPLEEPSRRWILASLKRWRFQPPTLNGQAIESQTQIPLRLRSRPEAEGRPEDFRRRGL
jgi:hypothetical protein